MRPIKAFDQGLYDNPWSWRQRGALETRGLKFRRCWCHLSASSPPALLFSMRADHFAGLNNSEYLPDWVTGGPRPLNLLSFCPAGSKYFSSEVWSLRKTGGGSRLQSPLQLMPMHCCTTQCSPSFLSTTNPGRTVGTVRTVVRRWEEPPSWLPGSQRQRLRTNKNLFYWQSSPGSGPALHCGGCRYEDDLCDTPLRRSIQRLALDWVLVADRKRKQIIQLRVEWCDNCDTIGHYISLITTTPHHTTPQTTALPASHSRDQRGW